MQDDDTIETDYSCLHSEPLDIYSRHVLYDEDFQDNVYGTDEEFNTLFYDIDHNLDNEASDQQIADQASISKSVISTFVCTQQNTQSVCLAQVNGKVKRMWVKALFKSDPKVNPNLLLICQHIPKLLIFILFIQQLYTQVIFILSQTWILNFSYV